MENCTLLSFSKTFMAFCKDKCGDHCALPSHKHKSRRVWGRAGLRCYGLCRRPFSLKHANSPSRRGLLSASVQVGQVRHKQREVKHVLSMKFYQGNQTITQQRQGGLASSFVLSHPIDIIESSVTIWRIFWPVLLLWNLKISWAESTWSFQSRRRDLVLLHVVAKSI